jgi:hypothetical protein
MAPQTPAVDRDRDPPRIGFTPEDLARYRAEAARLDTLIRRIGAGEGHAYLRLDVAMPDELGAGARHTLPVFLLPSRLLRLLQDSRIGLSATIHAAEAELGLASAA